MKKVRTVKDIKNSFIFSLVLITLSLVIGFSLLSFVYTGPRWVKAVVFIFLIFVLCFLYKYSFSFINSLKDEKKEQNE